MAITKTTTVQRIEVYPGDDPTLMVVYNDLFDDPDDDMLPNESQRVIRLEKMTSTTDDDGNVTETATDVSAHDALVQTIAAAVWTD
jgi:hypothetical protein